MSKSRPNIPDCIKMLSTSKIDFVIEQSNLGLEDTKIAKMYLIDKIPQVEIAEEVELTQRTVSNRCRKVVNEMVITLGNKKDDYSNKVILFDDKKVI